VLASTSIFVAQTDRHTPGDSEEPVPDRPPIPDRPRFSGEDQKRGLEGVFGVVLVPEDAAAGPEDEVPRAITPEDRFWEKMRDTCGGRGRWVELGTGE
jgi:hypothetical protein